MNRSSASESIRNCLQYFPTKYWILLQTKTEVRSFKTWKCSVSCIEGKKKKITNISNSPLRIITKPKPTAKLLTLNEQTDEFADVFPQRRRTGARVDECLIMMLKGKANFAEKTNDRTAGSLRSIMPRRLYLRN